MVRDLQLLVKPLSSIKLLQLLAEICDRYAYFVALCSKKNNGVIHRFMASPKKAGALELLVALVLVP